MFSKRVKKLIVSVLCVGLFYHASASDTLRLTLQESRTRFEQQNLILLANHFNVDVAKAQTVQASLRPNPTLNFEGNLYAPNVNRFLSWTGENGLTILQVQQLIRTAGKRNKLIDIARLNEKLNENQFFDLLRTLNATVRQDFFTVRYLENELSVYDNEIITLKDLVDITRRGVAANVVPQKELLRLQVLLFGLQNDRSTKLQSLNDVETELRTLLVVTPTTYVTPSVLATSESNFTPPAPDSLYNLALSQRADLKVFDNLLQINQANLRFQNALRTPDVTLGIGYQSTGNFTPNYTGISASLPLPIFDKNQGNIQAAKIQVKQQETANQAVYQGVQQDIFNTIVKLLEAQRLKRDSEGALLSDFEKMLRTMIELYQKRTVTLNQLIDVLDAYRDSKLKSIDLENSIRQTKEHLNLIVGKVVTD